MLKIAVFPHYSRFLSPWIVKTANIKTGNSIWPPVIYLYFISDDCNETCRTDFLCAMVNLKTEEMRQCQQQQLQLLQQHHQQQQNGLKKMFESAKSEKVERSVEDNCAEMVNVYDDLKDWKRGKEMRQQVGNDNCTKKREVVLWKKKFQMCFKTTHLVHLFQESRIIIGPGLPSIFFVEIIVRNKKVC